MSFAVRCPACGAPRPLAPARPDGDEPCPACGRLARWEGGVLVLDTEPGCGDYPPELYALDAEVEPRHWWHASRNAVLGRALAPWRRAGHRTLLEVGCGSGFVLAHLERLGFEVVGADMQLAGLAVARTVTTAPLVRSGVPVPLAGPVDVVALCDVLEHAEEAPLLAACREGLRPGGVLVVTVPARPSLWSLEDVLVGHRRRYTRASLRAALTDAGLVVRTLRPFHALVTPLAWWALRRAGPPPARVPEAERRERLRALRSVPGRRARRVFGALLAVEDALGAHLTLPFGSHLLAVAEREG